MTIEGEEHRPFDSKEGAKGEQITNIRYRRKRKEYGE